MNVKSLAFAGGHFIVAWDGVCALPGCGAAFRTTADDGAKQRYCSRNHKNKDRKRRKERREAA